MAQIYRKDGVKLRHPFPCPKCRSVPTPVVVTSQTEGGETIRKRSCKACGYGWFTFQEPEYLLPRSSVKWSGGELRLLPSPADLSQ